MNFADRMKEIIRKSLENKKDFLEQVSEKVKGFGQKGILCYEINVLEKDMENKFLIIGNEVYSTLIKKNQSIISKDTIGIKDILLDIVNLEKLIFEKELLLKQSD